MAVISFNTPLVKKEKNSDDSWNFHFERPSNFKYEAGQYIKMKLKIENPDDRGTTRYFTLSSSPSEEYLMVTTRILKSSFKLRLADVKVNEKVRMRGPWGDFVFRQTQDKSSKNKIVFIAGGIGMTPFRSMIKFAMDNDLDFPIKLFVSYKTPGQILYKEELDEITRKFKNIKIFTTITQPDNNWSGLTGRINTQLLLKNLDNLDGYRYYIAGPDPMVESFQKQLKGTGIKEENILTDGFPGY